MLLPHVSIGETDVEKQIVTIYCILLIIIILLSPGDFIY